MLLAFGSIDQSSPEKSQARSYRTVFNIKEPQSGYIIIKWYLVMNQFTSFIFLYTAPLGPVCTTVVLAILKRSSHINSNTE
jgi:hypothetical protein